MEVDIDDLGIEEIADLETDVIPSNDGADTENGDPSHNSAPSKSTKVVPKRDHIRRPQPKLDHERLKGPRGLSVLESTFKDIKYKGKGHEAEDLNNIMSKLQQWAHRLFPKYVFDDTLHKIENLGHKNQVKVYVKRLRMGLEDNVIPDGGESIGDDTQQDTEEAFDALLRGSREAISASAPVQQQTSTLTEEQRERMLRNRLLAEERRMARMRTREQQENAQENTNFTDGGQNDSTAVIS